MAFVPRRSAGLATPQRDKPDGAASKDHSFYLSKVKTCVVSLPSTRRGSRSSSTDGVPTPTSGDGDTAGFGAQAVDGGVLAPSPANPIVSSADNSAGRRGSASSSSSSAAVLSSPLPSPSPLPDAVSGGPPGFAHDEADRGAGGSGGDGAGDRAGAKERRSKSSRSMVVMPPNAAMVSIAGVAEGPGSPGPRHRALSIHFFGRAMTLDLWFAGEAEAVEWQVRLPEQSSVCHYSFKRSWVVCTGSVFIALSLCVCVCSYGVVVCFMPHSRCLPRVLRDGLLSRTILSVLRSQI